MPRRRPLLLFAPLLALAGTGYASANAAPPRIGKPRPAPATPPSIPPLPPAEFDPALAITGEELKARKIETRLQVDVTVNGRGPYRFVVDSGADTSVVGLRIAHALELPLGPPVTLNSMTARHVVDTVHIAELGLGGESLRDVHLPALREVDVGADGIIGIDALARQRLLMDFEKRTVRVEDARTPPARMVGGEIVVTARRRKGQLILTHVKAAGLPLEAVIDTGTQVTIGNLALRDRLIRGNRDKFKEVEVIGVTGAAAKLQFAVIGELQLGPVTLRDVPMAFADVPPFALFGLAGEPALLLGTDVLETFRRVSLDFRARKVRFQLRRCGTQGITLNTAPDNLTRLSSTGTPDVCAR